MVDFDELRNGFRDAVGMELTDEEANALFDRFDGDGSGEVDLDEMRKAFREAEKLETKVDWAKVTWVDPSSPTGIPRLPSGCATGNTYPGQI